MAKPLRENRWISRGISVGVVIKGILLTLDATTSSATTTVENYAALSHKIKRQMDKVATNREEAGNLVPRNLTAMAATEDSVSQLTRAAIRQLTVSIKIMVDTLTQLVRNKALISRIETDTTTVAAKMEVSKTRTQTIRTRWPTSSTKLPSVAIGRKLRLAVLVTPALLPMASTRSAEWTM